jgi:hypothetical protein
MIGRGFGGVHLTSFFERQVYKNPQNLPPNTVLGWFTALIALKLLVFLTPAPAVVIFAPFSPYLFDFKTSLDSEAGLRRTHRGLALEKPVISVQSVHGITVRFLEFRLGVDVHRGVLCEFYSGFVLIAE